MGGLNYQIEHHLFPSMPRPAPGAGPRDRARALPEPRRALHRDHAARGSYGIVIGYLNRVGLAARDPFDCPVASELR